MAGLGGSPGGNLTATNLYAGPSAPSAPTANVSAPTAPKGGITDGYYVAIAVIGGVMFSGTRAAPIVLGFLSVALIFQLNKMLA